MKLRLLDSEYNVPSKDLLQMVQEQVDPVEVSGEGLGIAPIGHRVTVEGAEEIEVSISTQLTLKDTVWESIQEEVKSILEAYFRELRAKWSQEDVVLRISQIEGRVLDVEGVVDITGTTLNGVSSNLHLSDEQVPILSGVKNE